MLRVHDGCAVVNKIFDLLDLEFGHGQHAILVRYWVPVALKHIVRSPWALGLSLLLAHDDGVGLGGG